MDIESFVSSVLKQVTKGINASEDSKNRFYIDYEDGVKFKIAVTATKVTGAKASDKEATKIEIAEIGKGTETSEDNTEQRVQHIEFAIKHADKYPDSDTQDTYESDMPSTSFFNPDMRF